MNHFYDQNIGLFLNVGLDLSFNSRTRQESNVNSHPPDGVDLCWTYILVSLTPIGLVVSRVWGVKTA